MVSPGLCAGLKSGQVELIPYSSLCAKLRKPTCGSNLTFNRLIKVVSIFSSESQQEANKLIFQNVKLLFRSRVTASHCKFRNLNPRFCFVREMSRFSVALMIAIQFELLQYSSFLI